MVCKVDRPDPPCYRYRHVLEQPSDEEFLWIDHDGRVPVLALSLLAHLVCDDVPQQTLFSWPDFIAEEPTMSKGWGRKPQPATATPFEWALTLEEQRELEPVGA